MHIEELLKLGAIRESRSPHRSAAFIVRNHAEEVRGKSRMVINYKRLNDNTIEDAYNIPNKLKIFPPNLYEFIRRGLNLYEFGGNILSLLSSPNVKHSIPL